MLIDWFTVGAQALNFVILVWLMKHFLYQPILNAIDAREKRIASEIAGADAKMAEAQKERTEFQRKNEEFDQERVSLLSKATDEAKAERQRLLDVAREAAEVSNAKRQETLRNEAHDLSQAIVRKTREEVFAIARKTLTDLATTSLEERMGEVFTRRLRDMNGQEKARLGAGLKSATDPVIVRSAFELPTRPREAIQSAINEAFSIEVIVRFETASVLIGGIELSTNGQKVAWSIDGYLGSLEQSVAALVGNRSQPEQGIKSEPVPALKGETDEHSA